MMNTQFRVSRALGLTFKSFGRNIIAIALIGALVIGVPAYLAAGAIDRLAAGDYATSSEWALVYPFIMMMGFSLILSPMLTYKVIQDLGGNKVSLVTSFVYGLRGILPALFVGIMAFSAGMLVERLLAGHGIGSWISLALQMTIQSIFFVAAPSAVAEKLGPFRALSRGAELTSYRRGGIFGMLFLLLVLQVILAMVWMVPSMGEGFGSMKTAIIGMISVLGLGYMFTQLMAAVSYALLREDKDGVGSSELARVFE